MCLFVRANVRVDKQVGKRIHVPARSLLFLLSWFGVTGCACWFSRCDLFARDADGHTILSTLITGRCAANTTLRDMGLLVPSRDSGQAAHRTDRFVFLVR